MRQIIAKEIRDLAPVVVVLGAAGFGIAWSLGHNFDEFVLPPLALLCAACGAAVGVTQGLLDRRRRDDPFLLHRPMSALRIHTLRGLVGAAAAVNIAAICVARAATVLPAQFVVATGAPSVPSQPSLPSLDAAGSFACIAGALVFQTVTRLALTPRRPVAAAALLVVLPTMVLYALLSVETQSAPWLLLAAVSGAAMALASLQLSGRSA